MINVVDRSDERCMPLCDAVAKGATSVKFESHIYIIIYKGDSVNTTLRVTDKFFPLLNVKSRTIRGISGNSFVEIIDLTVTITKSN